MPTTYAIPDGRTVMAATPYTGTGATQSISNAVNGVSMQPDFVWFKRRSAAENHWLTNSVTGSTKGLFSNLTDAEATRTDQLTSFNTNGFSLGADTAGYTNINGNSYIAWQWKAGGTAVSNTAGSITSSVSANTTAGFSVVTYTGTGANATVGHGLGVAPSMMILKNRSSAVNWRIYHASLANASTTLDFTTAAADGTNATTFNATAPTSTVFSLGTSSVVNGSGNLQVAYCFAAVAGYSAFGSYTGNGSADGPFNYLGFRPRFIMLKRTDSAGNWTVYDSTRSPYNASTYVLYPNLSNAEDASTDHFDWLSNGFKMRSTNQNTSGGTFIYMAFAQNPYKYVTAV